MKLYLVYADVWTYKYGICIELVGIFENEESAIKAAKNVTGENPDYDVFINVVDANKQYGLAQPFSGESEEHIILGSYIE